MPCLLIETTNVFDLPTCSELSFYESLNRPDIYDLSCSNGTPYTDEYIDSISEFDPIVPAYFNNKLNVATYEQQINY